MVATKPVHPANVPLKSELADTPTQKPHEEPQSPSSEASSGYFSHSVSTATLFETSMSASSDVNSLLSRQVTSDVDISAQSENREVLLCEGLAQSGTELEASPSFAGGAVNGVENLQYHSNETRDDAPQTSIEVGSQTQLQNADTEVGKDCGSFHSQSLNPEETVAGEDGEWFSPSEITEQLSTEMVSTLMPAKMSAPHTIQTDTFTDISPVQKPASSLTESKPEVKNVEAEPKYVTSNPFKIQRVRTSELKSFTGILSDENTCQDSEGHLEVSTVPTELCPPQSLDFAVVGASETGSVSGTVSTRVDDCELPSDKLEVVSDSEEAAETIPEWLKDGEYVLVGTNKTGTVRYIGPTEFADGIWIGIELDVPAGKNDGSVGGKQYFRCNPGYGVLVRPSRVTRASGSAKRRSTGHRVQLAAASENRRSGSFSKSNPNLSALTTLAKSEGGAGLRSGDKPPRKSEQRKSWSSDQKP